ncbi:MAG: 16S rRNA (adenine(1518)-N(6)/adenine(1519)-N(6))-dimethyltransferase RsmA [Eggerthellaceae bacterium]|jgi:16S rRNA (adenine1518-N6/adenine1519-N6)-dimethyltransferase|nr:16S rRNA (adenine(1518)-N(6)/adenine(1519)-N(6))-dimethyltransferase RsmA [Eggerthellaceae bacterium]
MGDRYSSLASVSATRAVLEAHGLATKKSLGQNFLVNDDVIRRICELSGVGPVDDVVEVGPGIGTLTVALLARARRVVSIERDPDLPAVLAETCAPWADRFTLISNDALAVQPDDLPFAPTAFIANLPYAVAATLVLDYFERFDSIQRATVMVQAEVADRMMAQPGTKNYGAYTVKLALFARPASRFKVAPGNFFPPPHVDSAVIRLDRCAHPDLTAAERAACALMADAAFATRRKTIQNSMRTYFGKGVPASAIADLLDAAGIDARRRGESLSLDEFKELGRRALACGIARRA